MTALPSCRTSRVHIPTLDRNAKGYRIRFLQWAAMSDKHPMRLTLHSRCATLQLYHWIRHSPLTFSRGNTIRGIQALRPRHLSRIRTIGEECKPIARQRYRPPPPRPGPPRGRYTSLFWHTSWNFHILEVPNGYRNLRYDSR